MLICITYDFVVLRASKEGGVEEEKKSISHRVIYSAWDFQQALSALIFLSEECDFDAKYNKVDLRRFRCFETTMIVSFCRPFKTGRGREALDLSKIGFEFTQGECDLKDKLLWLRDKIISHSDEEEMEYRACSIRPADDIDLRMPVVIFREALYLNQEEYAEIESLLRRIIDAIARFKFDYAQSNPNEFDRYKVPKSSNPFGRE